MSVTECRVAASPEAVFQRLADGWCYSQWVVGTSHLRAVELSWPAPGSRIFHSLGVWPLVVRDETAVESAQVNRRLVLIARAWPTGQARVEIDVVADGDHARVRMVETPTAGPAKWLHNPVADALLHRRNLESLDRLAALVERRAKPAG